MRVQVTVNGQPHDVAERMTVEQLLAEMQLRLAYVAVELNGELIPRERLAEQQLRGGDKLEIVTLVGGG